MPTTAVSLISILMVATSISAQSPADLPRFEVASVKPAVPHRPGEGGMGALRGGPGTADPTRINGRGVTLPGVIARAYDVKGFQIIGGPKWFSENHDPRFTNRYDIMANVPPDTTPAQYKLMLQALLIDRFGLALHHETRELPVYYLSVAAKGTKLKEITLAPDQHRGDIVTSPRNGGYALRQIWGPSPISDLIFALTAQLKYPVIDKTELKAYYDFKLEFAGDGPPKSGDDPLPPLALALEREMGLKLEKQKADYDVLVIDRLEQTPTSN